MRPRLRSAALATFLLVPASLPAQDHHDHGGKLGSVRFPVSCSAPAAEEASRGLALLHHMTYEASAEAFAEAVQADPGCAMGYWGQAMALIHPLWSDPPSAQMFARGAALLEEAARRAKPGSWELAWIEATQAYFAAGRGPQEGPNLRALASAWEKVHAAYPGDLEAAALHALTLLPTADPADKSHPVRRRAGAVAESVLARVPDHPGAHHYIIHAYDVPELAEEAVRVARAYADVAPDVSHALHMPSHIFVRIGDWDRVIEWNRRAAEAALAHPLGDTISNHYLHALDYLAYGYLQLGRDEEARQVAARIRAIRQPLHTQLAVPYTLAAVPARIALERHDWRAAAALEPRTPADYPWDNYPAMEALTHFAIALGAAHTGELDKARRAIARLEGLRKAAAVRSPYWEGQVEIQRVAAEAWLAFAEGRKDEALATMQRAADLEGGTEKHPVTPGELLPAHELLGDMLMALGRPQEARAAYEAALRRSPGRRNAMAGVEMASRR